MTRRVVMLAAALLPACVETTELLPVVEVTTLTVEPTRLTLRAGDTGTLALLSRTGAAAPLDVSALATWTSSAPGIVSVTGGTLHALGEGIAIVSARLGASQGAAVVTVDRVLPAPTLRISPAQVSLPAGDHVALAAWRDVAGQPAEDVSGAATWTVADDAVATVAEGALTAVTPGVTQITARLDSLSSATTITVTEAVLRSLRISPENPVVPAGDAAAVGVLGTYSDGSKRDATATVTWRSANETIAHATAEGISAVAIGTSEITAKKGDLEATTTLTVIAPRLVSIEVSPSQATLPLEGTLALHCAGAFGDGSSADLTSEVEWTVQGAALALGPGGVVTAVHHGVATVTAKLGALAATTQITAVGGELVSLEVSPASPLLAVGTEQALVVTGVYDDDTTKDLSRTVTWIAEVPAIATVTANGAGVPALQGIAVGETGLTATLGSVAERLTVRVTPAVAERLEILPASLELARGTTGRLTARARFTDGTVQDVTTQGSWTSSAPAIATVGMAPNAEGSIVGVAPGSALVTVTFGSVSATAPVTVGDAALVAITVSPPQASVPVGNAVTLAAEGTFTDGTVQDLSRQVTWSSSDVAVLTVDNAGVAPGLVSTHAVGEAMVVATLSGVSGSAGITVSAAVLSSLGVAPTNPIVPVRASIAMVATGMYSDGSTKNLTTSATWVSSNPAVALVSNGAGRVGTLTATAPGQATITGRVGGFQASTQVTVIGITLVSLAVNPVTSTRIVGMSEAFSVVGTYSDGSTRNVTRDAWWGSSNTQVAWMDANTARARAPGTVQITASVGGRSATATFVVSSATVVGVDVAPATFTVPRSFEGRLTATALMSDGSRVVVTDAAAWTVTPPQVATIHAGRCRGASTGIATARALFGGKSGTAQVTVSAATLVRLSITPPSPTLGVGSTLGLHATGLFSDGQSLDLTDQVEWGSETRGTLVIFDSGTAFGVSPGTATVSARTHGVSASTTVQVH